MFLAAMAVITLGEMLMVPVSNALVFQFAPQEMRGRYSYVYGLSWGISFAAGPVLAGLIMDNLDPNWLWYACGLLGLVATLGFLALYRRDRLVASPSTAEEKPK
jgi:MFS family permease